MSTKERIKTIKAYNPYHDFTSNRECYMLKLLSTIFYQIFIFSPNDSSSKTMKNIFYFI